MSGNGDSKYNTGGYVDPNIPNPHGPNDRGIIIYGYLPNEGLALLATIMFFLLLLAHTFQLIKYRTWYFVTVPIGCLFEVVGYTFRTVSRLQDPYNLYWFVMNYFFVVVAPVFYSAAIYACLSVLINATGRRFSPLRPRWIVTIFIACDVIATAIQVAGAGLVGGKEASHDDPSSAVHILLAGLAFQVATFAAYLVLLALFMYKSRMHIRHFKVFLAALWAASLLIYMRTIFRLIESSMPLFNSLMTSETFYGCLEFAPVVTAIIILTIFHPGRMLKGKGIASKQPIDSPASSEQEQEKALV